MSWPLPQPVDLAERYAQAHEARDAFPGCDPREPNSFMAVTGRVHGEVVFDTYLYQRSLADELMIDTAQDWLPRHANTHGVPRIPAPKAIGPVIFTGPPSFALPAAIEFVAGDGTQWVALAGGETDNTGNASLQVIAEVAGTVLTIISTLLGLQLQTVTVGPGGLAGGAGGAPLVPTAAQVAAVQTAIDLVRPITDQPAVIASSPNVIAPTLALAEDIVANRALATAAFGAFLAGVPIGGLLDQSRLEDAIIQATSSGVELTSPAANVQAAPGQLLTAGAMTFVVYA